VGENISYEVGFSFSMVDIWQLIRSSGVVRYKYNVLIDMPFVISHPVKGAVIRYADPFSDYPILLTKWMDGCYFY
jgi:hypothetical protein